jgi:cyclopropane-fatty-acyl-phospholipid synthase
MSKRSVSLPLRQAEARAGASAVEISRRILADLLGPPGTRPCAVRFWDGTAEAAAPGPPRFTIVLRRPGALRRMLLPPSELAIGEAYLRDDVDIVGDLEAAAAALLDRVLPRLQSPAVVGRVLRALLALPTGDRAAAPPPAPRAEALVHGHLHSRRRDAAAIRFHYDVGNEFYALWLDRNMVYSCAYFATGGEDLDTAQEAKLDLICRKLRLQPGERLLDIGCGWGGLAQYAAAHYGVRALGITLSEAQAALARRRIAEAGLGDHCVVEVRDYRALPPDARFDKVVSVGMHEHVGHEHIATYFDQAYRVLRPGGLFLNHGIVSHPIGHPTLGDRLTERLLHTGQFLQRYVFADGELLPAAAVLQAAETSGFEIRDVENLREHYALTLRHWVRRLEVRHAEAVALVGEPTYRVWRLFMAAAAHGFATNKGAIIQTVLSKPDAQGRCALPLTRADLYAAGVGAPVRQ